jgi:hypothetical protein
LASAACFAARMRFEPSRAGQSRGRATACHNTRTNTDSPVMRSHARIIGQLQSHSRYRFLLSRRCGDGELCKVTHATTDMGWARRRMRRRTARDDGHGLGKATHATTDRTRRRTWAGQGRRTRRRTARDDGHGLGRLGKATHATTEPHAPTSPTATLPDTPTPARAPTPPHTPTPPHATHTSLTSWRRFGTRPGCRIARRRRRCDRAPARRRLRLRLSEMRRR